MTPAIDCISIAYAKVSVWTEISSKDVSAIKEALVKYPNDPDIQIIEKLEVIISDLQADLARHLDSLDELGRTETKKYILSMRDKLPEDLVKKAEAL